MSINNSIVTTPTKSSASSPTDGTSLTPSPSSLSTPRNNVSSSSITTPSSTTSSTLSTPSTPSSSSRMTTIVSSAPIIKKLPKHLQDTLKSGTNISSLSDCIKELIENALDAQATNIEIQLQGKECIIIKDNGHGIHQDNFETLCKRYYTHKFMNHFNTFNDNDKNVNNTTDNLNNNESSSNNHSHNNNENNNYYYGYKGEALNSICNLSKQVHIKTKYGDESELGTYLIYDTRGEIVSKTLIRMNRGTIITIQDLFSTIPVRKKCFVNQFDSQFTDLKEILISNNSSSSIITQSSPSSSIMNNSNNNNESGNHYTSNYRTPSPQSKSLITTLHNSNHSNNTTTPSPPIFNKRSVIVNNSGGSSGSGSGGYRSTISGGSNSTSNYSTNNNNNNSSRGRHIELDDSLLDAMDDLIGYNPLI
ncbi:predicted protein [Naegleria gruberi]|uniref:Predicted protein n=1 Tax=Naegleria gruberi TaxID=5762 RepID=D2W1D9_NAEGR|nr:uncharacterized protein NAEGRDRAFT_75182 [Naegleria gruberi]EFC37031.1 predicted protein [Naegleria gruberi]|eukprot:XP_002669775.1 predicted protein [Naegleria gruberi strain NEG-M]